MIPVFTVNFLGMLFGIVLGAAFFYVSARIKADKILTFITTILCWAVCFCFYGLVSGGGLDANDPAGGRMFDLCFGFLLGAGMEILGEFVFSGGIRKNLMRNGWLTRLALIVMTVIVFAHAGKESFFVYKSENNIPVVSNFAVIISCGEKLYVSCPDPFCAEHSQIPFRTKLVPAKYCDELRNSLTHMGLFGCLYGHRNFCYVVASQGVYEMRDNKEYLYVIRDWERYRAVALMRQIIADGSIPFE